MRQKNIESTRLIQSHFSLGGGDSDADEGVDDDEDNLEMTKYDEGEVAVNEEHELAVGSFTQHRKLLLLERDCFSFSRSTMPRKE